MGVKGELEDDFHYHKVVAASETTTGEGDQLLHDNSKLDQQQNILFSLFIFK
jgi:hypothetical protein